jgi:hypothetical protein
MRGGRTVRARRATTRALVCRLHARAVVGCPRGQSREPGRTIFPLFLPLPPHYNQVCRNKKNLQNAEKRSAAAAAARRAAAAASDDEAADGTASDDSGSDDEALDDAADGAPPPRASLLPALIFGMSFGTTTDKRARKRGHRVTGIFMAVDLWRGLQSFEVRGGSVWLPEMKFHSASYGCYDLEGRGNLRPQSLDISPDKVTSVRVRAGWWINAIGIATGQSAEIVGGEDDGTLVFEEVRPAAARFLAGFVVVVGVELLPNGADKPGSEHVMGLRTVWVQR